MIPDGKGRACRAPPPSWKGGAIGSARQFIIMLIKLLGSNDPDQGGPNIACRRISASGTSQDDAGRPHAQRFVTDPEDRRRSSSTRR